MFSSQPLSRNRLSARRRSNSAHTSAARRSSAFFCISAAPSADRAARARMLCVFLLNFLPPSTSAKVCAFPVRSARRSFPAATAGSPSSIFAACISGGTLFLVTFFFTRISSPSRNPYSSTTSSVSYPSAFLSSARRTLSSSTHSPSRTRPPCGCFIRALAPSPRGASAASCPAAARWAAEGAARLRLGHQIVAQLVERVIVPLFGTSPSPQKYP